MDTYTIKFDRSLLIVRCSKILYEAKVNIRIKKTLVLLSDCVYSVIGVSIHCGDTEERKSAREVLHVETSTSIWPQVTKFMCLIRTSSMEKDCCLGKIIRGQITESVLFVS